LFLHYIFFSQFINRIYIVSAAGRISRAQKDDRIREFEDRIEMRILTSVQVAAAILFNLVEIDKSMLARQNGR